MHRRVTQREAARSWVGADVGHPERPVLGHHRAEETSALRPVGDPGDLGVGHPVRDEPDQSPILDDPERRVAGAEQLPCDTHDLDEEVVAGCGEHGQG